MDFHTESWALEILLTMTLLHQKSTPVRRGIVCEGVLDFGNGQKCPGVIRGLNEDFVCATGCHHAVWESRVAMNAE